MDRGYWLINANRSEVIRFTDNRASEYQFNKYIFVNSRKIIGSLDKEAPLLQRWEELKLKKAREIYKN